VSDKRTPTGSKSGGDKDEDDAEDEESTRRAEGGVRTHSETASNGDGGWATDEEMDSELEGTSGGMGDETERSVASGLAAAARLRTRPEGGDEVDADGDSGGTNGDCGEAAEVPATADDARVATGSQGQSGEVSSAEGEQGLAQGVTN
jgi:hypothetical protein